MGYNLPPPTNFAEGQRLIYGWLMAAAGVCFSLAAIAAAIVIIWGDWPQELARLRLILVGIGFGGAMIGWWVGYRGSGWLRRVVSPTERARAQALLERWGVLAIIVSRFIPIIAETVAIMSGTTNLGWRKVFVATTAGTLPASLIYAIAGTVTTDLASGFLVMLAVVTVAAVAWLLGQRLAPPHKAFERTAPASNSAFD